MNNMSDRLGLYDLYVH